MFLHGSKLVTVIRNEGRPDEERFEVRGTISPDSGLFDVTTPIYEGDVVEFPDPRGFTDRRVAADVQVHDRGSSAVNHVRAVWAPRTPRQPPQPMNVYNGPVIHSSGAGAQIAWGANSIAQSHHGDQQVTAGFEAVATAVEDAARLLQGPDADDNERTDSAAAAQELLAEVVKPEPDPSVVRRSLAWMRGLLVTFGGRMGTAATTGAASELTKDVQHLLHQLNWP